MATNQERRTSRRRHWRAQDRSRRSSRGKVDRLGVIAGSDCAKVLLHLRVRVTKVGHFLLLDLELRLLLLNVLAQSRLEEQRQLEYPRLREKETHDVELCELAKLALRIEGLRRLRSRGVAAGKLVRPGFSSFGLLLVLELQQKVSTPRTSHQKRGRLTSSKL